MCTSNLEVKPKPHLARKRILLLLLCFAKKISHEQCLSICLRVLYVWSSYFFDEQISN